MWGWSSGRDSAGGCSRGCGWMKCGIWREEERTSTSVGLPHSPPPVYLGRQITGYTASRSIITRWAHVPPLELNPSTLPHVQVWDLSRDSSSAVASHYVYESVRCMDVDWQHGGGAMAALGCQSGSVALWDLERGRKLQVSWVGCIGAGDGRG